jgi:hypothetical protein
MNEYQRVCKSKRADNRRTGNLVQETHITIYSVRSLVTSSDGVSHTLDCQALPTERLNDTFDKSSSIPESSVTYQPITPSYKCTVWATGWGAVCVSRCVTAGRYVTPLSSHWHCDTNLNVCRADGERADTITAIPIWNYYCDHFVFVATITNSAPHDVSQITGRGRSLGFLWPHPGRSKTFEEMRSKTLNCTA